MGWKGHRAYFKSAGRSVIFYLTYNDQPSGIYSSQVLDVVKFIRTELNTPIRLVAMISLRAFARHRKEIKRELPDAIVLPMFPGVRHWRRNIFFLKTLCFLWRPDKIIGRSVLATQLALQCRRRGRKIIYDGRGAIAAEWKEYGVIKDPKMLQEIEFLESSAILDSDRRIAVSEALVKHWQVQYNYSGIQHVVIPCTLNAAFEMTDISPSLIRENRAALGIDENDLVYAYSGSVAGWQSFDLLYAFLVRILKSSEKVKLLFLSNKDSYISKLEVEFPGRIVCKKVSHSDVPRYLIVADYALLIRERSITNQVASPVKFAEYLACGLKVIISESIGDYSSFTVLNNCGYLVDTFNPEKTLPLNLNEKQTIRRLGIDNFTKKKFVAQYREVSIYDR
jgi:hypothetical protein